MAGLAERERRFASRNVAARAPCGLGAAVARADEPVSRHLRRSPQPCEADPPGALRAPCDAFGLNLVGYTRPRWGLASRRVWRPRRPTPWACPSPCTTSTLATAAGSATRAGPVAWRTRTGTGSTSSTSTRTRCPSPPGAWGPGSSPGTTTSAFGTGNCPSSPIAGSPASSAWTRSGRRRTSSSKRSAGSRPSPCCACRMGSMCRRIRRCAAQHGAARVALLVPGDVRHAFVSGAEEPAGRDRGLFPRVSPPARRGDGDQDQQPGVLPRAGRTLARQLQGRPGIILLDTILTRQEVYNLESLCDCFVSLHRSEGFGLGLAESMFLGKPVIGTAWSGNRDFMNPQNACCVDYRMIRVGNEDYGAAARPDLGRPGRQPCGVVHDEAGQRPLLEPRESAAVEWRRSAASSRPRPSDAFAASGSKPSSGSTARRAQLASGGGETPAPPPMQRPATVFRKCA